MTTENNIETLFKEHSFEEIESVRDNLAIEVEKRTNLLKSIVKEKYRDIVETSDAIQSMKLNLKVVEQSLWSLDKTISNFYIEVGDNQIEEFNDKILIKSKKPLDRDTSIKRLLNNTTELWDYFDSGNLQASLELLNESMNLLNKMPILEQGSVLNDIRKTMNRFKEMIKNSLWHRTQLAAPHQIGIIAGIDQRDLYQLSLNSSLEFLVGALRDDLSDSSYHAQLRRYQPQSYFNSETNQVDIDVCTYPLMDYIQIPKFISPELNEFLYQVCKTINTIAGFNLNRSSIIDSLRITIEKALQVYSDVFSKVELLKAETKRKRAMQLYFDLLYIRSLLNSSKSTHLIEMLDPLISDLSSKYEVLLDSIELYTISQALHSNVMSLSQTTIRLYGLLIPHLQ